MIMKGIVFSIQRFSVNDGPGIRTTIFMKGCKLRCLWCANPESQNPEPELMDYSSGKNSFLKSFGNCLPIIQKLEKGNYLSPDEEEKECVKEYYAGNLELVGKEYSIEELIKEVKKDEIFYRNSGGGITVSGGEPLFQAEFVTAFLEECKKEGFHTAIDTSGYGDWKSIEKMLPFIDLVLYDLKHLDSEKHKEYTEVSNELILENLKKLSETDVEIMITIPVIPGYNDEEENIRRTGEFIIGLERKVKVRLLPYHHYSKSKYKALGRIYKMRNIKENEIKKSVIKVRRLLNELGIKIENE